MSKLFGSLGRKGKDLLKKKMGNQAEGVQPTPQAPAGAAATVSDRLPLPFNIVLNPTFAEGTQGWFGLGCSLSLGSFGGSAYCIAHGRTETWHGLAQDIGDRLEVGVDYRVEAWVGIGDQAEEADVVSTVKVEKPSGGDDFMWLGRSYPTLSLFLALYRFSRLPHLMPLIFSIYESHPTHRSCSVTLL